jgi:hypothetical protein
MEPAITKAKDQKPDNAWGQVIYDTLFLDVKPIIAQLPVDWFRTLSTLEISGVGNQKCNLKFIFGIHQSWPNVFRTTKLAEKKSSYSDGITLTSDPVWAEFYAEVVAYNDRVAVATQRQTEFAAMVNQVIAAYSTLAPALKAWPPLWELIPEEVKNTHRRIVERTKNEVVLNVDIGKLTALSTAAKFGL